MVSNSRFSAIIMVSSRQKSIVSKTQVSTLTPMKKVSKIEKMMH